VTFNADRDTRGPAVVSSRRLCHIGRMNNPATYPYSLEVQPCDKPAGHFLWTIREDGRLLERAMRAVPTREEAENTGMKAVERMLQGASQPRGRSR
jgi:hypothetical protein